MNIGIYIYDDVEVLDFTGPFEVFTTAARVHSRINPNVKPLLNTLLIAEQLRMVRARGDFLVQPHYSIQEHPEMGALIVPGGLHEREMEKSSVITWIADAARTTTLTASVCTGAFLLAKAGLLKGGPCTTHWEDIHDLRSRFPALDVREGVPWVEFGQILTSAGISAGIEMALHVITRLAGKELALKTANQMEYHWESAQFSKELV